MTNTKQEWEEKWESDFDSRFIDIAKMADNGDDEGYGRGLILLRKDIQSFITAEKEASYQEGKDALEREYAHGSQIIKVGEHMYQHMSAVVEDRRESYQRGVADIKEFMEKEKHPSFMERWYKLAHFIQSLPIKKE